MDPNDKKKALRLLTYGLYVATSRDANGYAGGTIAASRVFAVHIVGRSQRELASSFFKGAATAGATINGFRFEPGVTGAPVLVDPPAWLECRVVDEVRRGDHTIFIGEVVAAGVRREEEPLTLRDAGFAYGG